MLDLICIVGTTISGCLLISGLWISAFGPKIAIFIWIFRRSQPKFVNFIRTFRWPLREYCMETETVKLLKALPNMLRKVMPTVVVATKYSQGKRTSETPIPWRPMGLNLDFIILYSCAVPPEFYGISSHSTYDKCRYFFLIVRNT